MDNELTCVVVTVTMASFGLITTLQGLGEWHRSIYGGTSTLSHLLQYRTLPVLRPYGSS